MVEGSYEQQLIQLLAQLVNNVLSVDMSWLTSWHPILIVISGYLVMYYIRRDKWTELDLFDKIIWCGIAGFPTYLYLAFIVIGFWVLTKLPLSLELLAPAFTLAFMAGVFILVLYDAHKTASEHYDSFREVTTRAKLLAKLIPIVSGTLFLVPGFRFLPEDISAFWTIPASIAVIGPREILRRNHYLGQPISVQVGPIKMELPGLRVGNELVLQIFAIITNSVTIGFIKGLRSIGNTYQVEQLLLVLLMPVIFVLYWLYYALKQTFGLNSKKENF